MFARSVSHARDAIGEIATCQVTACVAKDLAMRLRRSMFLVSPESGIYVPRDAAMFLDKIMRESARNPFAPCRNYRGDTETARARGREELI